MEDQRPLPPGDRVKLNGRGEARVLRIFGDMAEIRLDALTLAEK